MLKQSSSDRNSAAKVQVLELTWMLKSPSSSVEGDLEHMEVRNSENSDMNKVEGLGGGDI